MFKFLTMTGLAIALGGTSLALSGCRNTATPEVNVNVAAFAQCLRQRDVTMYGADWCSHCQRQKLLFGAAFAQVPYVECPQDPQRCVQAGVEGYPTWITRDGQRLEGEQSLAELSRVSGCPLTPKELP